MPAVFLVVFLAFSERCAVFLTVFLAGRALVERLAVLVTFLATVFFVVAISVAPRGWAPCFTLATRSPSDAIEGEAILSDVFVPRGTNFVDADRSSVVRVARAARIGHHDNFTAWRTLNQFLPLHVKSNW